jgi:hypothetical protein
VKAASHIGARDQIEHGVVIAHLPGAEAFSHVAIEIDLHGGLSLGE